MYVIGFHRTLNIWQKSVITNHFIGFKDAFHPGFKKYWLDTVKSFDIQTNRSYSLKSWKVYVINVRWLVEVAALSVTINNQQSIWNIHKESVVLWHSLSSIEISDIEIVIYCFISLNVYKCPHASIWIQKISNFRKLILCKYFAIWYLNEETWAGLIFTKINIMSYHDKKTLPSR